MLITTLQLDEEFRYLQRKRNVVKELSEVRRKVTVNSDPRRDVGSECG